MDNENEIQLRSYLLGDLSQDEQQDLEKRLVIEPDALEELQQIEEELIDEYLEGNLSDRDKVKFENFFLAAPERKQKLSFAVSLKRYIATHKPKKSDRAFGSIINRLIRPGRGSVLKWVLAASWILLIGGGSWSTLQISKFQVALDREKAEASESRRQLGEVRNRNSELNVSLEQEQARSSSLEQEIADLKKNRKAESSLLPGKTQSTLFTAILEAGRSRSSGSVKEISVPAAKDLIKFDLKMELLTYPRYQVRLQRLGGDEIRNQIESSIEGRFPGLWVSARLLTDGDYVLTLTGLPGSGGPEEIEDYYFRVKHQ